MTVNPYKTFIEDFVKTVNKAQEFPLGAASSPFHRQPAKDSAAAALIFSPHPDDECIIGTLPLRLLNEGAVKIINVAVTQGSNKARQEERFQELQGACSFLNFDLHQIQEGGLEKIKQTTRENDLEHWQRCKTDIVNILNQYKPNLIFIPHSKDWNSTHIGTHLLVMDALAEVENDFTCTLIETEYWQPMTNPNLMVECSADMLAAQIAALSFHKGEVSRNPYHLELPAWMQDNVRRGSEIVGGQGGDAPDFLFAALYRISEWHNHKLIPKQPVDKILSTEKSAARILDSL